MVGGGRVRDTLGGRPFEATSSGGVYTIKFFPFAKGAKNPDAVIFRLTLTRGDLKKLANIAS